MKDSDNTSCSLPLSIAIIERGSSETHESTHALQHWHAAAHSTTSQSVKLFSTEIVGRAMDLPVGQGLGGSSIINAGLVTQPLSGDFDQWPEPWKSTLPRTVLKTQAQLNSNGVVNYRNVSSDEIPKHFRHCNVKWSPQVITMEAPHPATFGGKPVRKTYFDGLVLPIIIANPHLKEQLHWIMETEVQRLLIRKGSLKVRGVECCNMKSHKTYFIHCNHAVILCGGAIETPVLLLISGIGPEAHQDFQGVGRNLKDQILLPCSYLTTWQRPSPLSTNGIAALGHMWTRENQKASQVAIVDATSHSTTIPYAVALSCRRNGKQWISRQLSEITFRLVKSFLWIVLKWTPVAYVMKHFTSTALILFMHPKSTGTIAICPKEPNKTLPLRRRDVSVNIEVGYLKDPEDVASMRHAWDFLTKGSNVRARAINLLPSLLFPENTWNWFGGDWFAAFCSCFSQPYFHFSGTCAMKSNDGCVDWVVGSDLRLRRYDGVFVCDASVFPSTISSPPALTCCSIGYELGQNLAT